MGDDVREYLRAAQAAELQGNKTHAVELLRKAATLYKNQGNHPRALQMLRHARRLDGKSTELAEELSRLEWLPDRPLARAAGEEDAAAAVSTLDELERPKELIERGPSVADPTLAAWCSFCCRPRAEVGDLVAGPAGAFICAGCASESGRLLGARGAMKAPKDETPIDRGGAKAFVGQQEALRILDVGMRLGARCILVLGPEGSGKTTYLRDLEERGLGIRATDVATVRVLAEDQRLLLDLDAADDAAALLASAGDRPLLAVVRGQAPSAGLSLKGEDCELPLYASSDLMEATSGRLPRSIAERVQVVAAFRALSELELAEIARRLLTQRAAELDLSDELVSNLAALAATSPRQGHELKSLLERIPPGSWTLPPGVELKRRKKKKGGP